MREKAIYKVEKVITRFSELQLAIASCLVGSQDYCHKIAMASWP